MHGWNGECVHRTGTHFVLHFQHYQLDAEFVPRCGIKDQVP